MPPWKVGLLCRLLGAQPGLGLPRQTALFPIWIVRSPRQGGFNPPNSTTSQATSNAVSRETGAISPISNNNKQAGSRSGRVTGT